MIFCRFKNIQQKKTSPLASGTIQVTRDLDMRYHQILLESGTPCKKKMVKCDVIPNVEKYMGMVPEEENLQANRQKEKCGSKHGCFFNELSNRPPSVWQISTIPGF